MRQMPATAVERWWTATGSLCAIMLHSSDDYRPNNCTCWYSKTNWIWIRISQSL